MRTAAWTALNVQAIYNNAAAHKKFFKTPVKHRNIYIKATANRAAKRRTSPHALNYPAPLYGKSIPLEPKAERSSKQANKKKRSIGTKRRRHSDEAATDDVYLKLVEEKAHKEVPPSRRRTKTKTEINF